MVAIRDLVTVRGGGTPRKSVPDYFGGNVPWVTPKDMKRWLVESSEITLTEAGVANSPAKPIPAGAVLVVVRSGVLKHTLPVALATRDVTVNQDMKALIPTDELHGAYLARLLKARQPEILSWVRATTADNFSIDNLLDMRATLPSLAEQRRIAAILDQADALRAKRRRSLALLRNLERSAFDAEFTDAGTTTTRPLGQLAEIVSGLTKGRKLGAQVTRSVPYLAVANVQDGHLKLDTVKEIEATEGEIDRYRLLSGDIVMTEGGDPDKLGRGTIWRGELPLCLHQNHIFRVRVHSGGEVESSYLAAYIAGGAARSYFLRSAKQTTGIASINTSQLRGLPVVVPSLASQRRFISHLEHIRQVTACLHDAAYEADALFASLQSRAFSGELARSAS